MNRVNDLLASTFSDLPDLSGGDAIVIAIGSHPPAMTLLSTGDVLFEEDRVSVAVHSSSSVVKRFDGSFTLLVPTGDGAVRVEVTDAAVEVVGPLARMYGEILALRATVEPPWRLELRFGPASTDDPAIGRFVDYWRAVRSWLSGDRSDVPTPPG